MTEKPRISVLLPVRNATDTLDAALRSLWRQSFTDFEVLAVDDASTDETCDILNAHAGQELRLHVLSGKGTGIVNALELARARATAPYLARMDADDICHRNRFAMQVAYIEKHPRVGAVGSRVTKFPRSPLGPGWRRYLNWLNGVITPEDHARELFVESPLAHPSVLMRADAVERAGGYRDPGWPEDYDLWFRLSRAGWDLAKVDATLLGWRHSKDRHSMTDERYSLKAFHRCRAHHLARLPAIQGSRVLVWGAGRTGRTLTELLSREGVTVESFFDVGRKKIGRTWLGAPIRSWKELPPAGDLPLLVMVGASGARELIDPETARAGYTEGKDLWFAGTPGDLSLPG